jgi:three-Cys-motif partner protein
MGLRGRGIYETDPRDGLPAMRVNAWTIDEKHRLLRHYVGMSAAARKKFLNRDESTGCAYIDPFSGSCRVHLKKRNEFHDGSPAVVLDESLKRMYGPFGRFCLADYYEENVQAVQQRLGTKLRDSAINLTTCTGPASETIEPLIRPLSRGSLHFALLDPYNLSSLPWSIIECLAKRLSRVDLLIHFSSMHLMRSLPNFISGKEDGLDFFAPGWRDHVNTSQRSDRVREQIFDYWVSLLEKEGFKVPRQNVYSIRSPQGREVYKLVYASRHPLGLELWSRLRAPSGQASWDF